MFQLIWSGCSDEQQFGYDPTDTGRKTADSGRQSNGISWSSHTQSSGEDSGEREDEEVADELQLFQRSLSRDDHRDATLIQIDEEHGILYPRHGRVLTFDPAREGQDAIAFRTVGVDDIQKMFCILPRLGDVDLGELHAGEGQFSRTWKERLRQELATDPDRICNLRRTGGVTLVHLRSRMDNWAKPPTTVIHAPQNSRDFETLINVLGIGFDSNDPRRHKGIPWWRYAWKEIQHARGEAIQTGLKEHEIINEELLGFLNNSLPLIREKARKADTFEIPIVAGQGVYGDFLFFKIVDIEDGFFPPDSELKCVRELAVIEQWRV
jgi:hypothetical protein